MYGDEIALTTAKVEITKNFEFDPLVLERLKSGDQAAFDALFHLYKKMVFRLAFRLLGEHEEALDLSQEVFLTIYKKIKSFRGDANLKTWIYRIVITRAANRQRWWRRRMRNSIVSLDAHFKKDARKRTLLHKLASAERTPYEILYRSEIEKKINQVLQTLPIDQRIAVIMRDSEGLSYEEIAQVTRVSLGTVKSRIARAREVLCEKLKGILK